MAKTAFGDKSGNSFWGESATSYEAEPLNEDERELYKAQGALKDGYTQEGRRVAGDMPGDITDNDEADRTDEMREKWGSGGFMGF
jgi:hypothetical protein